MMSLPWRLGTTLETIPANAPYIFADPERVAAWHDELAGDASLKVGIAWQGNPHAPYDRERSIPLAHFEPLARVPGVRLFSLQKGPGVEQLAAATDLNIVDFGDRLDATGGAFMDTAAIIENLDLVITSDTALRTWPEPWARTSGWRYKPCPTGAGCSSAKTAPGIRRCDCSANAAAATGPKCLRGLRNSCGCGWNPHAARSRVARR